MSLPLTITAVRDEFDAYEELSEDPKADRNRLLITLGKSLEAMPDALKTESTLVSGCNSNVWVYPLPSSDSNRLHFLADSNSALTKGIIAAVLMVVQDKSATDVLNTDIEEELLSLDLQKHFTSLRTSGLKNMILKIYETAERLAG